mgnify:CR=1 FL=1
MLQNKGFFKIKNTAAIEDRGGEGLAAKAATIFRNSRRKGREFSVRSRCGRDTARTRRPLVDLTYAPLLWLEQSAGSRNMLTAGALFISQITYPHKSNAKAGAYASA